jgi:hypothetical protein
MGPSADPIVLAIDADGDQFQPGGSLLHINRDYDQGADGLPGYGYLSVDDHLAGNGRLYGVSGLRASDGINVHVDFGAVDQRILTSASYTLCATEASFLPLSLKVRQVTQYVGSLLTSWAASLGNTSVEFPGVFLER